MNLIVYMLLIIFKHTYKTKEITQYLLLFNKDRVSLRRELFYYFNLYNS